MLLSESGNYQEPSQKLRDYYRQSFNAYRKVNRNKISDLSIGLLESNINSLNQMSMGAVFMDSVKLLKAILHESDDPRLLTSGGNGNDLNAAELAAKLNRTKSFRFLGTNYPELFIRNHPELISAERSNWKILEDSAKVLKKDLNKITSFDGTPLPHLIVLGITDNSKKANAIRKLQDHGIKLDYKLRGNDGYPLLHKFFHSKHNNQYMPGLKGTKDLIIALLVAEPGILSQTLDRDRAELPEGVNRNDLPKQLNIFELGDIFSKHSNKAPDLLLNILEIAPTQLLPENIRNNRYALMEKYKKLSQRTTRELLA